MGQASSDRRLRRRLFLSTMLAGGLSAAGSPALAQELPTGPTSIAGAPTSGYTIDNTNPAEPVGTINLGTNSRTIWDWNSFSVDGGASLNFVYTGTDNGAMLNRVTGASPSTLNGPITGPSNLSIYLLNPNGILFGADANINVGAMIASTLDLDNDDFNDGDFTTSLTFSGASTAPITVSGGSIATVGGANNLGQLVLIGASIDAAPGSLTASGDLAFVAATNVTMTVQANSLLSFAIDAGTTVANPLTVGGTIAGRNVLFAFANADTMMDAVLSVNAMVTANTVMATDRGIVLAAGTNATGVTAGGDGPARIDITGGSLTAVEGSAAATANVEIRAKNNVTGSGAVTADDDVFLTSDLGAINYGGAIAGVTLTGSSTGATTLTGANEVTNLGAFSADGFELNDADGLSVTGVVNGGTGDVTITTSGALSLGSTVTAGTGTVTLTTTAGGISGAGLVTGDEVALSGAAGIGTSVARVNTAAGTLAADGGTGGVFISETNAVTLDDIGAVGNTATADYDITAGGTISVPGTVSSSAGSVLLATTGGGNVELAATGQLDAAATVSISAAGAIDAAAGADIVGDDIALTAQDYTGQILTDAVLQETDDLSITDTAGGLDLGALSAAGTLTVTVQGGGTLNVNGALSSTNENIALSTVPSGGGGDINLNAGLTTGTAAGRSVTLNSADEITQSAGIITTNTLTGSSGGATTLTPAANQITNLGAFTGASFALNDAGGLDVTGVVQATQAGGTGIGITTSGTLTVAAGGSLAATNAPVALTTTAGGGMTFNGPVGAGTGTVTLTSAGTIGQNTDGVITAGTLTGSSVGGTGLDNAPNSIGTLGAFTNTGGGGIALRDAVGALAVGGAVNAGAGSLTLLVDAGALAIGSNNLAGTDVNLTAVGITQAGASIVDAGAGTILLDGNDGDISLAGALTTLNNGATAVRIIDAGNVTIGAITTGAGGTTTLGIVGDEANDIGGNVTQTVATTISTGTLSGDVDGSVTLTNTNQIANLGPFTAGGGFALTDAGGLTVAGAVSGGPSVSITTSGALAINAGVTATTVSLAATDGGSNITQNVAGVITAGTLTGSSGGSTTLTTAANAIGTLGAFTAGTGFALSDGGGLTIGGAVDGGPSVSITTSGTLAVNDSVTGTSVSLTATGGTSNITQGGGVITAGTLTGSSGGSTTLTAANAVTNLDTFTTGSGFAFNDTGGLAVIGAVTGGSGNLSIATTGDLTSTGAGDVTGIDVTLDANSGVVTLTGDVNVAQDYSVRGADFAGNALNPTFTAFTDNDFTITDTVGGLSLPAITPVSGTLAVTVEAGNLTVTGAQSATEGVQLTTLVGSIAINNAITTPNTVTLTSATTITQNLSGVITAGTLTGSSAGGTDLDNAANSIGTLGAFTNTGSGGIALRDAVGSLAIGAAVNAGGGPLTLLVDAGQLNIGANGLSGQGVSLTAVGITQDAGSIVDGGAGTILLDGSDAAITMAGALTTTNDTANAVRIIDAATVTAGSITTGAAGTTTLGGAGLDNISGNLAQTAGTAISTGTLAGNVGGSATLDNANLITTLGAFSAGSGFALTDGGGLTVAGPVAAGTGALTLSNSGLVALGASALSGQSVSLTAVGITQDAGGTVNGGAGTILLDGSDGAIILAGSLATTNATADAVRIIDATVVTTGNITTGAAGTTTLGGAAGDNISGNLAQTAGTAISTGTLAGNVGGSATLDNANLITTLGAFSAGSGFALTDGGGLTVAGPVNGGTSASIGTSGDLFVNGSVTGGAVSLAATRAGSDISLAAAVNATSTATLQADGIIGQTAGGVITAGTLTGSSAGSTTLTAAANALTNLGAFNANGFALNDVGGLTVTDAVNGNAGGVSITTSGDLAVDAGVSAADAAIALTATGANSDIDLAAVVNAGNGTVTLTANGAGGTIDQTAAGVVTAGTLTGSSNAGTNLTAAANQIGTLGAFTANGFALRDANGLIVAGPVEAGAGALSLLVDTGNLALLGDLDADTSVTLQATAGAISQTSGTIETPSMTATAATGIGVNQANLIGEFTALNNGNSGGILARSAQPGGVVVVQVASGGGNIMLTGDNGLRLTGATIAAAADDVTLASAVTLTGASSVAADGGNGNVTFASTVDGPGSLGVSSTQSTLFSAAVGAATPLAALSVSGPATLNGGSVTTLGAQDYDNVTLAGAGTGRTFASTGGGAITFGGTLDGAYDVTVTTSGATRFENTVGAGTALASLTTNGNGTTAIDGGSVRTIGAQTYEDAVTLGTNATLASTAAGTIRFAAALDGPGALTVDTTGVTRFDGAVGDTTPLAALETNALGATEINAGRITTAGTQSYGNAVLLIGDTVLASLGTGAQGNIGFANTLNGARALTVNTAGQTRFGGVVGGNAALASLTTDAPGTTAIDGDAITTSGNQSYRDTIALGADATLRGTGPGANATFDAALDGNANDLTIAFTGAVDINAGFSDLGDLTIDASSIDFTGQSIEAAGDIGLTASGALTGASVDAGGSLGGSGGSVGIGFAGAGGTLELSATAGQLTLEAGEAGADATLTKQGPDGELQVTTLTSGTGATITSSTSARIGDATSGGSVMVTAATDTSGLGTNGRANLIANGTGSDVTVTAGQVARLGTVLAADAIGVTAASMDVTSATAGGALALTASSGQLTLGAGSAGTTATLAKQGTAAGSELQVTTLSSGSAATINSATSARIGDATSGGNLTVTATNNVTGLSAGRANLAANGTGSDLSVTAGEAANLGTVAAADAVTVAAASIDAASTTAGGALALTAGSGPLTLGTGSAGTTATLTQQGTAAGSELQVTTLTSGGAATIDSATSARIGDATSGGGLTVTAATDVDGIGTGRPNLIADGAGSDVTVTAGQLARLGTVRAAAAVGVTAARLDVTSATATGGALALTANSGQLTLGTGNSGTTATLTKRGETGDLAVTTLTAGGDVAIDSDTTAELGQVTATGRTIAIRADDLNVATAVSAGSSGTVAITNGGTGPTSLGGTTGAAGAFLLTEAETNRLTGGTVTIRSGDNGNQPVRIAKLALGGAAGSTSFKVLTTGRIDVLGRIEAGGSNRTIQIGGANGAADANNPSATLASIILISANPSAGASDAGSNGEANATANGRIILDGATLDLRGARIAAGESGFLGEIGLTGTGTGRAVEEIETQFIANAGSSLYGSVFTTYNDPILIGAASMTVTYSDYGLFQNTAFANTTPSGVRIGTQTSSGVLRLNSNGEGAFALFGEINGSISSSTALLGPTIIIVNNIDPSNSRVNGCLIGSGGGGCLVSSVTPVNINVFDSGQAELLSVSDELEITFDPIVGTNNEALFGFGSIDTGDAVDCAANPDAEQCSNQEGNDQ